MWPRFSLFAILTLLVASTSSAKRGKVILDNDWGATSFIPILQALKAGQEIVGITSSTANSWAKQCGLHALALLEVGNLTCIPVYKGSDYPLLNNPKLFQAWELLHGKLPWEGAFAPLNHTMEAQGNDPTSGNPDRVVKAAFLEGFPNTTFASDISAAEFMVQQVRKHPGEISIYAAGAMTNLALAIRLDSTFARNTKELVIMGGFVDVTMLEATGSKLLAELQSDVNLMIDPEASKIALTADFPNITIAGNVANQVMSTQSFLDEVAKVKTPYSTMMHKYYGTQFPFWDETAAAILFHPEIVKNTTEVLIDVDTSFNSPSYGNIHVYQNRLKPHAQKLGKANYVIKVDEEALKWQIKGSVQHPPHAC